MSQFYKILVRQNLHFMFWRGACLRFVSACFRTRGFRAPLSRAAPPSARGAGLLLVPSHPGPRPRLRRAVSRRLLRTPPSGPRSPGSQSPGASFGPRAALPCLACAPGAWMTNLQAVIQTHKCTQIHTYEHTHTTTHTHTLLTRGGRGFQVTLHLPSVASPAREAPQPRVGTTFSGHRRPPSRKHASVLARAAFPVTEEGPPAREAPPADDYCRGSGNKRIN